MAGLPPSTGGRPFTPSRIGRFFFPSRSLTCGAPTANLSQQSKPAAFSPDNADVAWVKRVTLDGRAIPSRIGAPAWAPSAYDPTSLAAARQIQGCRGPCEVPESAARGFQSPLPCSPVLTAFRILRVAIFSSATARSVSALALSSCIFGLRDLLVEDVGRLGSTVESLAAHVVLVHGDRVLDVIHHPHLALLTIELELLRLAIDCLLRLPPYVHYGVWSTPVKCRFGRTNRHSAGCQKSRVPVTCRSPAHSTGHVTVIPKLRKRPRPAPLLHLPRPRPRPQLPAGRGWWLILYLNVSIDLNFRFLRVRGL